MGHGLVELTVNKVKAQAFSTVDSGIHNPDLSAKGVGLNPLQIIHWIPRLFITLQPMRSDMICEIVATVSWCLVWQWKATSGRRMVNRVADTFQVDRRVHCMINCTLLSVWDSYNYRTTDKTCQFNTHNTPLIAAQTDMVADSAWN